MTDIISPEWLLHHLDDPDVIIIDCRFTLGQPEAGFKAYQQQHLPGAFHLDLEKDLSGPITDHGGRHPLPNPQKIAKTFENMGIDEQKHVIAYDDQQGAMAARLWWLLQYLGHSKVSILDGGWSKWIELGYPTTTIQPEAKPTTFTPHLHQELLAEMEEIRQKLHHPDTILVDSRDERRYRGEYEPMDPIAGHIPGARNYFWQEVLQKQGEWKKTSELEKHFQALPKDKEIIVYCGSGVTATPNFLALKQAGYKRVKLYAGSWSDWISYPDNPIAKGEENG
ncbi:thiosulfate/3-mercaptopyruvate sulfurtransferase [Thermoflavimicrobium dichotomicum]|uniref:Thiosulfate/3-mercaptopyruvate sulfurtransferase n=1 Tax=Thermoflavimicrobium dichotomicum TaxID=46223 RepID=A0A1I3MUH3_9BACL|nr:sulfurtransferase [Thermoflavimicrobium dichotomicum]SFJ00375.1 thiosulfate/3-mercaptopyruvate sulfurtransferase [Thermoflavimicrobium dichotomicum]